MGVSVTGGYIHVRFMWDALSSTTGAESVGFDRTTALEVEVRIQDRCLVAPPGGMDNRSNLRDVGVVNNFPASLLATAYVDPWNYVIPEDGFQANREIAPYCGWADELAARGLPDLFGLFGGLRPDADANFSIGFLRPDLFVRNRWYNFSYPVVPASTFGDCESLPEPTWSQASVRLELIPNTCTYSIVAGVTEDIVNVCRLTLGMPRTLCHIAGHVEESSVTSCPFVLGAPAPVCEESNRPRPDYIYWSRICVPTGELALELSEAPGSRREQVGGCVDDDRDGWLAAQSDGYQMFGTRARDCDDACASCFPNNTELCDGYDDNDCDGTLDEGCTCSGQETRPCGTAVGACQIGTQTCSAGSWGVCQGTVGPVAEFCDGVDNDCDGMADEGLTGCDPACLGVVCPDDGRACNGPEYCALGECVSGPPLACGPLEWCDESRGCVQCLPPMTQTCYTGPPSTRSVAPCQDGIRNCSESGRWSASCTLEIVPAPEDCFDGNDQDCDGHIDCSDPDCASSVACQGGGPDAGVVPGDAGVCECDPGSGIGLCLAGDPFREHECLMVSPGSSCGYWSTATVRCASGYQCFDGIGCRACGLVGERCCPLDPECSAGLSCNGSRCVAPTDCVAGQPRTCYQGPPMAAGVGECDVGTEICSSSGTWSGACEGDVMPTVESCNGLDDDCDGSLDDDLVPRACTSDCGMGTESCVNGAYGTCSGPGFNACTDFATCSTVAACTCDVAPGELCNSADDDCDGAVDEGLSSRACTSSCGVGTQACVDGAYADCSAPGSIDCTDYLTCATYGACSCSPAPSEVCNGLDDDCDGAVDDDCACITGAVRPCYTGPTGTLDLGVCVGGIETCEAGAWSSCVGQVLPTDEVCDSVDDDCDGEVDERVLRVELTLDLQASCSGGWELVSWDDTGAELPRSALGGVLTLMLPGSYSCMGSLALGAFCPSSGTWQDWTVWTSGSAESAGIQSILLDGQELADVALVCNFFPGCSYGAASYWTTPRIPLDATLAGACDSSPETCPSWCDGNDLGDPACY